MGMCVVYCLLTRNDRHYRSQRDLFFSEFWVRLRGEVEGWRVDWRGVEDLMNSLVLSGVVSALSGGGLGR